MATRTALLNGNVINRDTDFSKHIEAVSEPGVISGFAVSSSSVAVGQALVKCERTNGDTIYAVVYNNSAQSISGDGDVYIEIPQELIDNGELMNEDGSEIAEIKVGTIPSKNALKLATKSGSTITDARNMIKKSGELLALINQNIEDIEDLDERVEQLEEAGAINHLEESGFVGENYSLSDTQFKQFEPTLANSTIDCKVGDEDASKEIHIQRIASGTASNTLKLKVKSIGSPTTGLVVEVRKGTLVNSGDGYWYGGNVIASGSIAYNNISGTYAEKTVTLNNNFGGTKGELLDVVVYQTGSIVQDTNYYCIACDESQYSSGFGYLKVDGNTRVKSNFMPYCSSTGFSNSMLSKKSITTDLGIQTNMGAEQVQTLLYTATKSGIYKFNCTIYNSSGNGKHSMDIYLNEDESNNVGSFNYDHNGSLDCESTFEMKAGDRLYGEHIHLSYGSGSVSNMKLYSENAPKGTVPLKPNEVESIGEIGYTTSYGIYPNDNKFYGGVMIGTSEKATTGSISLGNAVGFITVNLNGEIVKIPYYNE